MFIAPDGLPVRIRVTLTDAGVTITVRVDTLAINVPVDVKPPPVAQTISQQRLKKLERRSAAREAGAEAARLRPPSGVAPEALHARVRSRAEHCTPAARSG